MSDAAQSILQYAEGLSWLHVDLGEDEFLEDADGNQDKLSSQENDPCKAVTKLPDFLGPSVLDRV